MFQAVLIWSFGKTEWRQVFLVSFVSRAGGKGSFLQGSSSLDNRDPCGQKLPEVAPTPHAAPLFLAAGPASPTQLCVQRGGQEGGWRIALWRSEASYKMCVQDQGQQPSGQERRP